jgi:apolipoprotein N-acyltransferase
MPVAAFVSGALLAGASLPAPLGALAFVGLAPLLRALLPARPLRCALRDGFVAGLLFFGAGFAWVFQSEVGGGLALPLAFAVTIPLLALGFGLFALAIAALARRSPRLALCAAPGLWVSFEFARSQDWMFSIPWNHLGYALADQPFLAQGAGWFGVYGLSAWIVAVNAGLVLWPRVGPALRGALAVGLLAPLAAGLAGDAPARDGASLRIAAVQPALAEHERHAPERLGTNLGRLVELSQPVARGRPDLVVWPESAWERALGPRGDAFLAAIAHGLDAPLVTGAWRAPAPDRPAWRNTAVLATSDGRTPVVAEKVHPVAMYERAPDGAAARLLARAGLWFGRFGPGEPAAPLELPRSGAHPAPIGVLICIDASHPELARGLRLAGARLLVSIANEAGSGAWSAALHARVARLRAIENRVPVVRVANTGPTLWIDARGRVVAALRAGEPAAAAHALALAGAAPPYSRIGDRAVVACAFLTSLAAVAVRRFQRPRGNLSCRASYERSPASL